jgi:hypothetical protein
MKLAGFYRDGYSALIALHDKDRDVIAIESTYDIDDILMEVTSKYIEQQYSNFDGIQHDCIDFYRNKFNALFDKMEDEL